MLNKLELNVLTTILNDISILTVNKDRNYYRLCLFINKYNINNKYLENFISTIFNYDKYNNRYYLYGTSVITLLEQLPQNKYPLTAKYQETINNVLNNKYLFTRSKGTKITEFEYKKLETLYNYYHEQKPVTKVS